MNKKGRINMKKILHYIQLILLFLAVTITLKSGGIDTDTYQYWAIWVCIAISRLI